MGSAHIAEGRAQGRSAPQKRCNSQDIFLRRNVSDDVYSWEFGQLYPGAYKGRSYDADCRLQNKRERTLWSQISKCYTHARADSTGEGLGVLRNYGPYHNSGPALGDLHRAFRRGAGPDEQETWGHDLYEDDSIEELCGLRSQISKPPMNRRQRNY